MHKDDPRLLFITFMGPLADLVSASLPEPLIFSFGGPKNVYEMMPITLAEPGT